MKYQLEEELSKWSSLVVSDSEESLVFDKIEFALQPKEKLRLDMQREVRQISTSEAEINDNNLIKYRNFEKMGEKLYLIRTDKTAFGIIPFESSGILENCQTLLNFLTIIKKYHQQQIVLGGISEGHLLKNNDGKVFIQDPLVMNYLSKSISDPRYTIENVPEVIAGSKWDRKSDLFSWGVLAYRLLTGRDPFQAKTKEERLTKIVRMNIIAPKDICPKISTDLNRLILDVLSKVPNQRPDIDKLIGELTAIIDDNRYEVSDAEAETYQKIAASNLKKQKLQESIWWWFKKYGNIVLIALSVIVISYFLITGSKSKVIINKQTKPIEVVQVYFDAVKTIDAMMLAEAAPNVKNSHEILIANLHVNNAVRRSVDFQKADLILVNIEDLAILPLEENTKQVRYQVNYRLKIIFKDKIEYTSKQEEMLLKPIRRIWRIVEIKPVSEKIWVEVRQTKTETVQ